jgi:hypothetical protein
MKCYTHHIIEAVAICRACNRALCPDCVTEVGGACACKNRCEERVTSFNEMVFGNRADQMRPRFFGNRADQMRTRFFSPLQGIIGLFFLIWGILNRSNPIYPFLVSFGAIFVVWSIIGFVLYMRRK